MAQWQRKVDLRDVWDGGDTQTVAKALSDRLRALVPFDDDSINIKREELADQFADLASDQTAGTGEFDALMHDLYDWADISLDGAWNGKKVCWIATIL